MFYTYILYSFKYHKFYIGYSSNLKERIQNHLKGYNKTTKPMIPLKLIYYEAHLSKNDALRREKYFKTTKGKSTLRQMIRESLNEIAPNSDITKPRWV